MAMASSKSLFRDLFGVASLFHSFKICLCTMRPVELDAVEDAEVDNMLFMAMPAASSPLHISLTTLRRVP